MRALRIVLYVNQPATLPLAYNELIQGLLYSCWRDTYPDMHDTGFGGVRGFRPFTFGRLDGKARVDRQARIITFYDTVSLEVRSPSEELMDELANQLASKTTVYIGRDEFRVINLTTCDRLLFPERAVAKVTAPVVAYERLEDGHTRYYSPAEPEWLQLIQHNTLRKAAILGLDTSTDIQAIPLVDTLRKHVTRFKGTMITGWTGEIILAAKPELLAALWCLGLGQKNSQGFGLFDYVERPL